MSIGDARRPSLLYVEDDGEISAMTIEVLGEVYDVAHESDGLAARDRALRERFDLIVLDRRLPGLDGEHVVAALRTARITTPVLLLTALGSIADRVDGLDAGANDYLVKPFDYDELLARLRALHRGFRAEGRRRTVAGWTYVPDAATVYSPDGTRVTLTATENALLELLTSSPDHVFSREEIAHDVFSSVDAVTSVDTYVHYLRRKCAPDLVETVRGRGYRAGGAR
ncbi:MULTISPECIES: response regulator transcription factor [Microbacterium]|jgi:two-component system response regulator QseB|uniref:response regulator transcription factor n=1 Tax=Microbacterium TaxID=33882 RepID=UPI001D177868|nr:response regulator transcription factor [Microbacterium testaceum]MCC4249923.1 response regulator transcription factor [Microbacterium testaceum]